MKAILTLQGGNTLRDISLPHLNRHFLYFFLKKVLKQDKKWYGQIWTQNKLKNSHEKAMTKRWDEMPGIGLGLGLCFLGHLKVRLGA